MTRRRIPIGLAAVGLLQWIPDAVAAEESPPRWDPGRETASPVGNEIRGGAPLETADGVYGRFSGRLDLGAHAGATLGDDGAALAVRGSAHWLSTAGVYVSIEDTAGRDGAALARSIGGGVDLRPAFLPRWSRGAERGPGVWDLFLDSISLSVGAFAAEPRGATFGDVAGFEASVGFGLALAGEAAGPWLAARGRLRWADAAADGPDGAGLVTLGWHWLVLGD